ncbi:MAG: Nudix family hydrolase [Zoogloeaceae bacterium]|jgi:8-oxo-dGTP diphosphatase|nr:Nudix family hydrolase [Zoogloeaceae bacterium]
MPETSAIVQVAAAVLLRDEDFLLACRPSGKVYAGYWEFPGGKLEATETVREALARELREELGITVTAACPWLSRAFVYPHAHVHLHFWRVTAWTGEIGVTGPLEHSAVVWLPRHAADGLLPVSPLLPANAPILKALSLPDRMGITAAAQFGVEAELARLRRAFADGLRLVQLRDRDLPAADRQRFAEAVMAQAQTHAARVLVSEDGTGTGEALARHLGAHGLHLTAHALRQCSTRPDFPWVGASCHNEDELRQAEALLLDYVLLGPVLPTASHPDTSALGWETFARLRAHYSLPVFALGGQSAATLNTAQTHGAHGIAALRGW